ncbi:MAG: tRNA (adenosine(37)-N6)-threonylcarbamoyltransferase complex dimerization subunit type 1 TsaB [Burkholderiales bacterium]|nr:MAG: tRNA (adenosine(37)-N6)-threonylcarbamoyltransferase complex dimerization subunit type 1 TsaB [Burkholderiales bacterium]
MADAAEVARARLLALATSGQWCSVALHRHDGGVDESDCLSERLGAGQSERILAMVRELCAGARIGLRELDAIAFDAGPGSFTGLRIGCAVAQGLGFALRRPLLAVDALATLAWQRLRASRLDEAAVLVASDARMGELYVAMYRVRRAWPWRGAAQGRAGATGGGLSPLVETLMTPRLVSRAGFLSGIAAAWPSTREATLDTVDLGPARVLLGGNAWQALDLLGEWAARHGLASLPAAPGDEEAYVRADALAELAHRGWREGAAIDAAAAAPRYVRDKVALDRDEQRALRMRRADGVRP